jgi:hypothetical protein
MSLPAILFLMMLAANFTFLALKHGEPQDPYNFWVSFFGSLPGMSLLYLGGFFS